MDVVLTMLAGVAVALATAYFTSRFYVHQATTDLRNEYQRRFNDRKWDAYTGFSATLRDMLKSTTSGRLDREMPKIIGRLHDFISDLWLVGSDDVVDKVLRWRRVSQGAVDPKEAGLAGLVSLADILIAMRRDLGDTETSIEARDILGTFINDVDLAMGSGKSGSA